MNIVEFIRYDAVNDAQETVGRCFLEGGEVHCEGPEGLLEELQAGIVSFEKECLVTPADGEAFMRALPDVFQDAHFYAVCVE